MKKYLFYVLLLPLLITNVYAEEKEGEEGEAAKPVAKYMKLSPDFIVNLQSSKRTRLMSVSAQVMGHGEAPMEAVQHHLPAIRHSLVMLFSEQVYDEMKTVDGKKSLLEKALTAVNEVLEKESKGTQVEAIYFTSLIIQ